MWRKGGLWDCGPEHTPPHRHPEGEGQERGSWEKGLLTQVAVPLVPQGLAEGSLVGQPQRRPFKPHLV